MIENKIVIICKLNRNKITVYIILDTSGLSPVFEEISIKFWKFQQFRNICDKLCKYVDGKHHHQQ